MKEKKEESNLIKKIYLICYSQPRYREEIKKMIYNKKSSYPYADGIINKMLDEKAGFPLAICTNKTEKESHNKNVILESDELTAPYEKVVSDGRARRGEFYISKIEPVFQTIKSRILEMKKTPELTTDEEKIIISMLKDNGFRESFEVTFSKIDFKHQNIDPEYLIINYQSSIAGIFYVLKKMYGEEELGKIIDKINTYKNFDKKAKEAVEKRENIKEALDLISMDLESVLKLKNLSYIFNKADLNLLHKIMVLYPQNAFYVSTLLMLQDE